MTHYCTACGYECEIDDGSVEPELMRHAIRQPFAPASDCCGAEFTDEDNDGLARKRAGLADGEEFYA